MNPSSQAAVPLNVGYSTYKSKRASSATTVPTEQTLNEIAAHSPPGTTKLLDLSSLNKLVNGVTGAIISSSTPAFSRIATLAGDSEFIGSSNGWQFPPARARSPSSDVGRSESASPTPSSPRQTNILSIGAPSPSTGSVSSTATTPEHSAHGVEDSAHPVPVIKDEPPAADNTSITSQSPRTPKAILSEASLSGPSSSSKSPAPSRQSTFRHVPLRSSKPTVPSPLRPSSSSRTVSGLSASSSLRIPISSTSPQLHAKTLDSGLGLGRTSALQPPASTSRSSSQVSVPSVSSKNPPSSTSASSSIYGTPSASPGLHPTTNNSLPSIPAEDLPTPTDATAPLPTKAQTAASLPLLPSMPSTPATIMAPASRSSRPHSSASVHSASPTPSQSTAQPRPALAPYRPGFQPKGAYTSRTDEFLAARSLRTAKRSAEDKRLTRRLEKLVDLHFSSESTAREKAPPPSRRSSSFFDLSDLKGKGAADLWKGVVESAGNRNERYIREQEQVITHWEDDKSVNACPICIQTFHPLTNRKHHCRLCGRVVCSLPSKAPSRPRTCSLLIVANPRTGKIDEVAETIAYGVTRKDSLSSSTSGTAKAATKESRGVRICRDCHAVVQRQQFALEIAYIPPSARLYRTMLRLEQQIEGSLSHFQEMIISLQSQDSSTEHSAAVARKELLEMFAEYDAASKRIRALPCDLGSSQDRVHAAMAMRANLFLQQHMLPLKSLAAFDGKQKHRQTGSQSSSATASSNNDPTTPIGPGNSIARYQNSLTAPPIVDSDAALAMSLQPLLEQETLLESYVEEAMQARKFEDAKTIQMNLKEIRAEIDKLARGGNILS